MGCFPSKLDFFCTIGHKSGGIFHESPPSIPYQPVCQQICSVHQGHAARTRSVCGLQNLAETVPAEAQDAPGNPFGEIMRSLIRQQNGASRTLHCKFMLHSENFIDIWRHLNGLCKMLTLSFHDQLAICRGLGHRNTCRPNWSPVSPLWDCLPVMKLLHELSFASSLSNISKFSKETMAIFYFLFRGVEVLVCFFAPKLTFTSFTHAYEIVKILGFPFLHFKSKSHFLHLEIKTLSIVGSHGIVIIST